MVLYIVVGAVYLLGIPISMGVITQGYEIRRWDLVGGFLWPTVLVYLVLRTSLQGFWLTARAVTRGLWWIAKAIVQGLYLFGVWLSRRPAFAR